MSRRRFLALVVLAVLLGAAFAAFPRGGDEPVRAQSPSQNAQFVSQFVPTAMTAGRTYAVAVTFKNTGTTSWNKVGSPGDYVNAYRIKSQNPADNTTWGMGFVPIPRAPIAPGENALFTFTVTAPAVPGTYNFQWQMNQGGVGWFGNPSSNVTVEVVTGTPNPPPPSEPPPPRPGFVHVQGNRLMLDGEPWWSKGANWLGARSVRQYCLQPDGIEVWCNMRYLTPEEWRPQELEEELRWLHEVLGINTLRLNAFGLDGNGDWIPGYDTRILEFTRMAHRQGMRIAWTLFFGVPGFRCPQPDGTYVPCNIRGQPDIRGAVLMAPGSQDETNVLAWARNFAALLKNEPGVLAYEVGNELLLNGTVRAAGYQEQILSYITRIVDEVRRADPTHFFVSGEVAVIQGPSDNRWPWLEGKGVDFVKFPDIHRLRGGWPFSLEDVVDVNGPHMYQPPENVRTATDVIVAAAQKPVLFGEFGGGGLAAGGAQWPEPNDQARWHKATIAEARSRLAGAWVWNPVPFMDFKPGTYRIETWTDNAGNLRPLIILFGPPERRIKALSFGTYTFVPQDNPLNSLAMLPAAKEFANRRVEFVSQNVPSAMQAGEQYPVSIALRNAGDSPWDRGGNQPYTWRLKSQNPADNTSWGVNAVPMPGGPVRPGQTATFSFLVTAPTSTGVYNFQWGLNQAVVDWFGSPTPNVAVTVSGSTPPPAPPSAPVIVSFRATPPTITRGEPARLVWATQQAIACEATRGWGGAKDTNGSEEVRPADTAAYVLTCRNSAGQTVSAETTVTVTMPPSTPPAIPLPRVVTFRAGPPTIAVGQSSRLTWETQYATNCEGSGGWNGNKATSGTEQVHPTKNAAYLLACRNGAGARVSAQVTVIVAGTAPAPGSSTTPSPAPPAGIPEEQGLWKILQNVTIPSSSSDAEKPPVSSLGDLWVVAIGAGVVLVIGLLASLLLR